MKRIVLIVNLLFALVGLCGAQTTPAKTAQTKPATTKSTTAPGPTKKDGTPDMRYKANKDAAKNQPAGPTKKDGTPDMRYKANKQTAAKTSATPATAPKKN